MTKFKNGDLIVDIREFCDPTIKYGVVFIKHGNNNSNNVHAWWGETIEKAQYNYDNKIGNNGHTNIENIRLYQPKSWKERIQNG